MVLNPLSYGSSSEWGFLLLAARVEAHQDMERFVGETGGGGLDWAELTRMARFHGVTGLLHHSVAGIPNSLLSQEERKGLLDDHRIQARRILMGQALGPLAEYGYHIRSRDSVGDKLQFLAGSLLTPSTEDLKGVGVRLPPWAVRFRRPGRLARKVWGLRKGTLAGEPLSV